jgi:hypothetical protein
LTGDEYREMHMRLYARLVLEMRRDAFEMTDLPEELVGRSVSWYFPR